MKNGWRHNACWIKEGTLSRSIFPLTQPGRCNGYCGPDYPLRRVMHYGILCISLTHWRQLIGTARESIQFAGKPVRFLNKNLFARQRDATDWQPIRLDQLFPYLLLPNLGNEDTSARLYPLALRNLLNLRFDTPGLGDMEAVEPHQRMLPFCKVFNSQSVLQFRNRTHIKA